MRGSEARGGREREDQGHRRRGELRRCRALSDKQFSTLGRLTCARRSRPSALKRMRSSERWLKALRGGKALGTRRRRLGELQLWAVVRCARGAGERARERARRGAQSGGENVEGAGAVHGRRGGRGVGERACQPRGATVLMRSGARARPCPSAGGGRGCGRGGARPASLARPVGWRRPASEESPLPTF